MQNPSASLPTGSVIVRQFGRRLGLVPALCGALLLSGCGMFGGNNDALMTEPPPAAEGLYAQGLAQLDAGNLGEAVDSFRQVDQFYPYTDIARRAIVMGAFASFERGDYVTSIEATERFLALYPTHEDAPYALFILGQSYLRQVPDVTRDQENTRRAMAAFDELVTTYPNSQYTAEARLSIVAVRDQLAGQEMQIGRYYLERREFAAAINRFRVVVEDYQDTRLVEEALYRLTEANLAMGLVGEAQNAAAVLGHNFPNSEWYQEAFDLLVGVGVQPAANAASPIAQAFN